MRAAGTKEKISSPDLGTIAGNEGLSPGRLCVSYSMSFSSRVEETGLMEGQ